MRITLPNSGVSIGQVLAVTGSVGEMEFGPEADVRYSIIGTSTDHVIVRDAIPPYRAGGTRGPERNAEVRAAPVGSPVWIWTRIVDGEPQVWWHPELEVVEFFDCDDGGG